MKQKQTRSESTGPKRRPVACYSCEYLYDPIMNSLRSDKVDGSTCQRCTRRGGIVVNPVKPKVCPFWTPKMVRR